MVSMRNKKKCPSMIIKDSLLSRALIIAVIAQCANRVIQTNTFPWIPQIPPKIHGLSAALNGRINSQISFEIHD